MNSSAFSSGNLNAPECPVCISCGSNLQPDEMALTKKMINRASTQFLCLHCLALKFDVPETILMEKIKYFREMGCTLFS